MGYKNFCQKIESDLMILTFLNLFLNEVHYFSLAINTVGEPKIQPLAQT